MTTEEIKKNAPEGATHYIFMKGNYTFYRIDNGVLYIWCVREWAKAIPQRISDKLKPL